ncbi:hypothetical protein CLAFUR0_04718 [Fulvia fulva]|nr:hypothetical protein CLAFUR0_04718 [Fulvia fulva]
MLGTRGRRLAELDQPVFKNITPERWLAFRKLFENGKNILWITSGRLGDDPWSNMTIGRSAVHEEADMGLRFLHVPDAKNVDAGSIAETLLIFASKEFGAQNILHTFEPELVADAEGRQLVPRLKGIAPANNRYNSAGRTISHEVDPSQTVVELKQTSEEVSARELSRYEVAEKVPGSKIIELKTTLCSQRSKRQQVTFSLLSELTAMVPAESAVPIVIKEQESALLARVAAELVAIAVLDPLYPGHKLVVYEASQIVAQAIASQAWAKGVDVNFTTNATAEYVPSSWIQLSPYMGRSELSEVVPSDIASFIGFGDAQDENQQTLLATVSPHCRKETTASLFAQNGVGSIASLAPTLKSHLERAIGGSKKIETQKDDYLPVTIGLQDLANGKRAEDLLTLVDFASSTSVLARVGRLDNKPLFKGDKTYWLVGLSGALGISLCDWMIVRGVKNLVLTSRNPKIDQRWIDDHARNGVVVQIMRCDVTDETAIRNVHQKILNTLPPIIVLGSLHLDRIFHDVDLDFFVLLSSTNCVIGNVGQANYAAANMGMCGVAMNRQKRGLRSSVVNVGAIIGIGYITDSARQLDVTVAKAHMMHLSEEDFHQIFLEAMEAGHQDCPAGLEISTGLLDITPDCDIPRLGRSEVAGPAIDSRSIADSGQERGVRTYNCRTSQDQRRGPVVRSTAYM